MVSSLRNSGDRYDSHSFSRPSLFWRIHLAEDIIDRDHGFARPPLPGRFYPRHDEVCSKAFVSYLSSHGSRSASAPLGCRPHCLLHVFGPVSGHRLCMQLEIRSSA